MKTLKIDVNALMTDVKAIGNIDVPEHGPLCLVSEKNLVNILKTLGTIPAYELAHRIAERLKTKSEARDFNSKMLQEMLMEEMDYIQCIWALAAARSTCKYCKENLFFYLTCF